MEHSVTWRRLRAAASFEDWPLRSQLTVSWCALLALLFTVFLWTAYRGNGATLRQVAPRLVYLIADFQNPTGLLMTDEQRAELAARSPEPALTLRQVMA